VKLDNLSCFRMDKPQEGGMEHHLVAVFTMTVEAIPENRGAKPQGPGVGRVDPKLMGTAGEGGKL
jgi:hypothetical protein